MPLTVTWGNGSSARTWSPGTPASAAPAVSDLTPANVQSPTPTTVRRVLGFAEPVLTLVAEVAGAGIPELLILRGAVAVALHLLTGPGAGAGPGPTEPEPAPRAALSPVGTFPWAA